MSSGTEFLTSNAQIAYPFQEDSTGLARDNVAVHGNPAALPVSMVVDGLALVSLASVSGKLYLSSITAVAGTVYHFVFIDDATIPNTIIEGDYDASSLDMALTYDVIEIVAGVSFVKFTVDTVMFAAYLAGCTADTFGFTLALERRVVDTFRYKLNSLITPDVVTGRILLVDGYNSQFTTEDLGNDTTSITLDLSPGAGLGVYPCAAQTPVVTKGPMGLTPDDAGNIRLVGGDDQCYSIIPNPGNPDGFLITSSCVACCSCEDYANVTTALRISLNKASLALKKLNAGRTIYQDGVKEFNKPIADRFIGPQVFASGYGGLAKRYTEGTWSGVDHGSPGWATVTVQIQNNSAGIVTVTAATLTLTPAFEIQTVNWTLDGKGGQAADLAPAAAAAGNIGIGRQLVMNVRLHTMGHVESLPNWSGDVTVNTHVEPPVGATWAAYDVNGLIATLDFQ